MSPARWSGGRGSSLEIRLNEVEQLLHVVLLASGANRIAKFDHMLTAPADHLLIRIHFQTVGLLFETQVEFEHLRNRADGAADIQRGHSTIEREDRFALGRVVQREALAAQLVG